MKTETSESARAEWNLSLTLAFNEFCDRFIAEGRNLNNCVISVNGLIKRANEIRAARLEDADDARNTIEWGEAHEDAG